MIDLAAMFGTIGILTGGGDAPGLNAVIRAVVKTATCEYGMRVIGIEDGFEGLLGETRTRLLSSGDVRGLLPRGGTILGTRNKGRFVETACGDSERDAESVYQEAIERLREAGYEMELTLRLEIGLRPHAGDDESAAEAASLDLTEEDLQVLQRMKIRIDPEGN